MKGIDADYLRFACKSTKQHRFVSTVSRDRDGKEKLRAREEKKRLKRGKMVHTALRKHIGRIKGGDLFDLSARH